MTVKYGRGKRSNYAFMGFARVAYPQDPMYDIYWCDSKGVIDDYKDYTPTRRSMSKKAVLRRIKQIGYPAGTRVTVSNWFVGYANLIVTV